MGKKIIKTIVELKYQDDTVESYEYKGDRGHYDYTKKFMSDKNVFFGKIIEVFEDGSELSRGSFCNGRIKK